MAGKIFESQMLKIFVELHDSVDLL